MGITKLIRIRLWGPTERFFNPRFELFLAAEVAPATMSNMNGFFQIENDGVHKISITQVDKRAKHRGRCMFALWNTNMIITMRERRRSPKEEFRPATRGATEGFLLSSIPLEAQAVETTDVLAVCSS